jgi:hypothetical protein
VLFITNQAALSRMITKAKWSKLNETQAQIERLEARESVLTKETLDDINKLMDYYNRIRNTRDSALDLRTGLNFLNSLLLPLVAILLGNLDKVLDLLR